MSINLIEHLRDKLIEYGAVKNTPEFCQSWLGRSEGYIRTLRYNQTGPSVEALAICASKLGYYADRLRDCAAEDQRTWLERFEHLQALCEIEIDRQAQAKWQEPQRMSL
jgi:hypothetical protein